MGPNRSRNRRKDRYMQNLKTYAVLTRTSGRSSWKFALAALVFATASMAPIGSMAFAQSEKAKPHCSEVGGAFVTNFIASDQTAGTATGDLKGALGVKVLAVVSGTIGA